MRKQILTSMAACMLTLSAAPLVAQQPGAIIIQMMMGSSGVAVPRHLITVVTGATPAEVRARKNTTNYYTDARGIVTLPLTAVGTGYLQVTIADMHPCELHPETGSYSVAEIAAKGVMVPNKCPGLDREARSQPSRRLRARTHPRRTRRN